MRERLAVFGGIYSNYLALTAALADVKRRGADGVFCLGDLGAFGPHPDRVFQPLLDHNVQCIQGNYDHSIGDDLADCQCGYTDPRDNHFARISYQYTYENTSPANRRWLAALPGELRLQLGPYRLLMCHGSPRKINEFLWESTTPTHFLDYLANEHQADVILATHTGIKWHRAWLGDLGDLGDRGEPGASASGDRHFINAGVLGRPEHDGKTNVWYTLLEVQSGRLQVEFVPVEYDHLRLAREMRTERLPEEFVETILTGWWTTCLEVLPSKERKRRRPA